VSGGIQTGKPAGDRELEKNHRRPESWRLVQGRLGRTPAASDGGVRRPPHPGSAWTQPRGQGI